MYELREEKEENIVKSKKKVKKGNLTIILLILIFIISGIFVYLRFNKLNNELNEYKTLSNSGDIEQEMVRQVLNKVDELIILPDEQPTVAAITNTSGLIKENPSFYKNAVDGDILIIYSSKAILYRESDNIIVNVAPVFIEPSQDIDTELNQQVDGIDEKSVEVVDEEVGLE